MVSVIELHFQFAKRVIPRWGLHFCAKKSLGAIEFLM